MDFYPLFADILDYPARPVAGQIAACAAGLADCCPEARGEMEQLQSEAGALSLRELQECYINAFDLRPDCTPNLGYHLFGDDGRRGLFLAALKERMEQSGIVLGSELPDHVSFILRYMDRVEAERETLIGECLLPAVSRMADVLDSTGNLYKHALRALLGLLRSQHQAAEARTETVEA